MTMSSNCKIFIYNISAMFIADLIIHRYLNVAVDNGYMILSTESVDNPVENVGANVSTP